MFHHDWVRTTGRVLDSRIRTVYHDHADGQVSGPSITLHNYVVEFRAPDGQITRLEVEQHIDTVDVSVGSEVPLLVSPDGKKAVFDKKDPAISVTPSTRPTRKPTRSASAGSSEASRSTGWLSLPRAPDQAGRFQGRQCACASALKGVDESGYFMVAPDDGDRAVDVAAAGDVRCARLGEAEHRER